MLAKDPLFSLLSDAPQELAQIEIGKGEPGIRGRAGGTKSEWHICSKPAPRCKGRTASRWRACNPPNTHPPPQTPQTVCRGAVYPSRRKKREPCAANLPSLPQGAHPAARPRHKQAHAKQIIAQKQGNVAKKANFAAKLRSVCAENHKRAVKVYKRDRCQKENQE